MENLLKEVDKSRGTGYSIIWRDYQIRRNRLPQLQGKEFVEEFINAAMLLEMLFIYIDWIWAHGWISNNEYNVATKILATEREWLEELLYRRLGYEN